MLISVVVPCYNSEHTITELVELTLEEIRKYPEYEMEFVLVNDCSKDDTWKVLCSLAEKYSFVKTINLAKNFGQHNALMAAFHYAEGDLIVGMDDDMQTHPSQLPILLNKMKEGYDVVHGRRRRRKGETAFKKATASFFYRFMRKITSLDMPADVGDFKLYDRKAVDAIVSLGEHDRLLRAQVTWVGFKQTIIEFDRPERVAGETHYTLKKMVKLAASGVFPNSDYPLTLPLKLGIAGGFLSVLCFIVFIVLACCKVGFGGLLAWLFPTITLAASVALVCHGLSNIYLSMIYREVQNRPKYIVAEKINL